MTVAFALVFAIGALILIISRTKENCSQLQIKNINQQYESMRLTLNTEVLDKKAFKQYLKQQKKEQKPSTSEKKRLFVLDFKGDIKASSISSLREEITAILTIAKQEDEVLVLIESGGGTVHGYGLGASQLQRIRDKGIALTAAVDKVAASGGYMMACVAEKIIVAPFAVLGSIGVLAQIPNFHRLLKKMNIDFEQITAGDYKRTLTLFGENTDQDREKVQTELEETHDLFKEFVKQNRPQIDIDAIATGEHWYGKRALALKLADEIITSDAYISNATHEADVFEISYDTKKPITEKLFSFFSRYFVS